MTDYEIGDGVIPCPDGQLWNNKIRECQDEEDWDQFMEDRWYSDDINEVNTSYDQDQPIGDEPQALNTELSNSEPIDAETGEDFYTIQTGGQSKKIGEFQSVWKQLGYESLNLDGTGVARATRGVNPNKSANKILRFIYVSKSDCPICKQYDGHSWAIDSPNRPIIPRLEGKHGDRPFTHPHCKCKWVNVFSDEEVKSSEVNQADFDRTRKWYGKGFDELNVIEQKMAMINMLKQSLGMETNTVESIIAVESEPSSYGIQNMLDDIVAKSLNKDEKKEIEESNELEKDFSLDTLLGLIADRLSKKIGKKLGVESRSTENDKPLNEWTKDDLYRSECQICGAPLEEHPITEGNDPHEWLAEEPEDYKGNTSPAFIDDWWRNLDSEEQGKILVDNDLLTGMEDGHDWDEINQNARDVITQIANEGGKGSGRMGHQKWMLAGEAGEECPNCMMITEKDNGKCVLCGK